MAPSVKEIVRLRVRMRVWVTVADICRVVLAGTALVGENEVIEKVLRHSLVDHSKSAVDILLIWVSCTAQDPYGLTIESRITWVDDCIVKVVSVKHTVVSIRNILIEVHTALSTVASGNASSIWQGLSLVIELRVKDFKLSISLESIASLWAVSILVNSHLVSHNLVPNTCVLSRIKVSFELNIFWAGTVSDTAGSNCD
jgi:hypothetical protein